LSTPAARLSSPVRRYAITGRRQSYTISRLSSTVARRLLLTHFSLCDYCMIPLYFIRGRTGFEKSRLSVPETAGKFENKFCAVQFFFYVLRHVLLFRGMFFSCGGASAVWGVRVRAEGWRRRGAGGGVRVKGQCHSVKQQLPERQNLHNRRSTTCGR
jgi:hypothetical protein